jgi:SAM-dependent methyltransferase
VTNPDRKKHWETVYRSKGESEVSWYQETPAPTLELLALIGATTRTSIIDIGGGASRLVDTLVAQGYGALTVLDVSETALTAAKRRLGDKGNDVRWIVADVTLWEPSRTYDVWHDRAAFHFMIDPEDRAAYVARLKHALGDGGHVIIGTFALDGPAKCSGLPVMRYDARSLGAVLGSGFVLIDTRRHDHLTPWGATQRFQFSTYQKRSANRKVLPSLPNE